jgi:hypothetical protein
MVYFILRRELRGDSGLKFQTVLPLCFACFVTLHEEPITSYRGGPCAWDDNLLGLTIKGAM